MIFGKLGLAATALIASAMASASEIVQVKLFDQEVLTGKLDLPEKAEAVKEIVIFVHGTGPGTYLDRRKFGSVEFNYFDLFSQEFVRRGIGFFAYNKRGVSLGTEAPVFETIDPVKYRKVVPSIEVKDIRTVVTYFRKQRRFKDTKIVLLGWSEGTVLAAMAADDKKSGIDALMLAGYANENMYDIIRWQYSGESSFLNIGKYFDSNKDLRISKAEFESTESTPTKAREGLFPNVKFEQLDIDKDGFIAAEDFRLLAAGGYKAILDAIQRADDNWIWKNYFHVTTAWLREHFALEPNKSRLLRLGLPIHVFQGTEDANCPVAGVYDVQRRFEINGKKNLSCHIFEGHNHDLNFMDFIVKKQISPGIAKIFEVAEQLKNVGPAN